MFPLIPPVCFFLCPQEESRLPEEGGEPEEVFLPAMDTFLSPVFSLLPPWEASRQPRSFMIERVLAESLASASRHCAIFFGCKHQGWLRRTFCEEIYFAVKSDFGRENDLFMFQGHMR